MATGVAPAFRSLPRGARCYLAAVIAASAGALALAELVSEDPAVDPLLLAVTVALCAGAGLFEVLAPGHYAFQPNLSFFFWGAVLLPPWAIAVLALACFVPTGALHRTRWYMVAFNVANYALAGLAAHLACWLAAGDPFSSPGLETVIALALAVALFVVLNHALIALAVKLSRRLPLDAAVRDTADGLPLDGALALVGGCLAVLWTVEPVLVVLVSGPAALVYRALWVPILREKSRTDPKTGLVNSEHFSQEFARALKLARKHGSDVSVVMIDLDHLRQVNNLHGHLAGDALIRAVADLVSDMTRTGGTAARFGGDEMCLLLPDRSLGAARELAETLRSRVDALRTGPNGDREQITTTISAGVASYPEHGDTVTGLLGAADLALYDAKLGGRNRVRAALPPGTKEALNQPVPVAEASRDGDRSPGSRASAAGHAHNGLDPRPEEAWVRALGEPSSVTVPGDPPAGASAGSAAKRSRRLIPLYATLLLLAAGAVGLASGTEAIAAQPVLLGILIATVLALDLVRIDIFERGTISPSAVPTLALAFVFGPLGPLAAESAAAIVNLARRKQGVGTAFDLGALGLSGAAAAGVFAALPTAEVLPLLVAGALAGTAYYAVNVPLLAGVMALAEGTSPVVPWRERLAWLWPHYLAFGVAAGTFVLAERALGLQAFVVFALPITMLWIAEKQYLDRSRAGVAELRRGHDELELANRRLRGLLGDNQELLARMHRSYLSTITSLARTIEAKDPYTGGHTERVAQLALMLGEGLGFTEAELQAVNVGALIHDIGKIGIPDQILLKQGKLSEAEFAEIQRHPAISSYIVAELELPAIVKQMVRSHHERFDGSGYPDGLAGEEIPLAARVLAVADSLDAMTSDRPYRRALPIGVARAEIKAKAGAQFCPRVVAGLESRFERDPSFWKRFAEDAPAVEPLPAPSA